jgi:hypothetical protein
MTISCSKESVEYSGKVETLIVSDIEEKRGSRGGAWHEVSIRTDNTMEHFITYDSGSFKKGDTIKVLTKTITITKECE